MSPPSLTTTSEVQPPDIEESLQRLHLLDILLSLWEIHRGVWLLKTGDLTEKPLNRKIHNLKICRIKTSSVLMPEYLALFLFEYDILHTYMQPHILCVCGCVRPPSKENGAISQPISHIKFRYLLLQVGIEDRW